MTMHSIHRDPNSAVSAFGALCRPDLLRLLMGLAFVSLLVPPVSATAQKKSLPPVPAVSDSQAVGSKKYDARKELARLSRHYNLTEDQKTKILPALEDEQKQVHKLGEDESLSNTEWVGAVRKLHQQTVLKVKAEMTDAQASKYVQDEAKWAKSSQDDLGDEDDNGMPPDGPPGGGPGGEGPPEDWPLSAVHTVRQNGDPVFRVFR